MIVYHGSTVAVPRPDVLHSYRPLDFGRGFYVTSVKEQAERWARRKLHLFGGDAPILNAYIVNDDMGNMRVKTFADDLLEWIDFVCDCRDGLDVYLHYDVIMGKVANDQVFRVVDMYHSGIWEKDRALREIKAYPNYDQIAFITQKSIDQLLTFHGFQEVSPNEPGNT